jgi:hypothetical protein
MRRTIAWTFALLTAAASGPASAQGVTVVVPPPPVIHFEQPPPVVEVDPGVQVVEDQEEEVFVVDGWYWTRRGDHWYRARDHRGNWVHVEPREVPVTIVRMPHGKYKHWKKHNKEVVVTDDGRVVKVKKEKKGKKWK